VQRELSRGQREMILRQQLRAIQKELGEDEGEGDLDALRARLHDAALSEEARKVVDRELKRLTGMGSSQAEYHVIRNYLELVAELPWDTRAEINDDLDAVAAKLDEDHFGLEEVKKRILEHLAVRKMTDSGRGAILCLVGPPGVGKTSLGQSIADATGRPFSRVALGGMRDEAEIRGHRRTYVGAMPGRVLAAIRKAGVKNPILVLDEIDKLAAGWMGSPEAALLEVLDPEQNDTFTDHYLDLPFELSEVMFICTANTLETVSPPLRDRLEVIEIQGYTIEEKLQIARGHLLPSIIEEHGLSANTLDLADDAVGTVVSDYTREAGVRQLKRELTKIVRGITLEIARQPEGKASTRKLGTDDLRDHLGKQRFFNDVAERTALPGVATGMAWTPTGGDILFVETSRMPGKGRIEITGQLGDVMRESARAALTYIRSRADDLRIEPGFLENQDLHIHVPAGAVPKDGPSAGVTIFTALVSLLTGRCVRSDTAMTGECTLRGRVLPVGGIKAKVLAARRAGIARVILPANNERDLDEIPEDVVDSLEIVFVEDMSQALDAALDTGPETELSAPVAGASADHVASC
jgi:ATP-dependent Lon protease